MIVPDHVQGQPCPAGECSLVNTGFYTTSLAPHLPMTAADLRQLAAVAESQPGGDDFYERLFQIDADQVTKCSGWESFFVATLAAHVIWDLRPTGVINERQGEWLIHFCGTNPSPACLALLVEVATQAHRVPIWFGAAVKARLARAVA